MSLDAGADAYVTKPFRFAELLARVRSLLRRTPLSEHSDDHPALIDHSARIDQRAHHAFVGDRELSLTAKEFDVLALLHRDEGLVITREQLMREVWGVTERRPSKTLDMHISVLRQKLGDDAHDPSHIFTIRSIGFRFHNDRP